MIERGDRSRFASPHTYRSFLPHGAPDGISRGDGSGTGIAYDALQRPDLISHSFPNGAGNVATSFWRNPAGQIAGQIRTNDAYAWSGHYAVNRAYTANGLNQYTVAGETGFAYDANGNLTSDGSRTYVYDIENRLVSSSTGAALVYDPLGRLFQVSTPTMGTTRFLYDGDALVVEYNGGNLMARRHLHWPGADVPMMTWEGAAFDPRHLHANERGSIVTVDSAAGLPTINTYDEYGIPGGTNTGRFQYTGQAWLAELGMYYYKARIYSPTLGRFLQTDPVGYEDGINLYAYVGNDPVNYGDPSGKCRAGARAMGAFGRGTVTVIICSDGFHEHRRGGSLAWRNNNPGNIEAGRFAGAHGAIGRAGITREGRFAVFPDEQTGRAAVGDLLQTPNYRSLTPEGAIRRYAPPSENETEAYQGIVRGTIGDTGSRSVGQLTPQEFGNMVTAIARVEGWGVGRVTYERTRDGSGVSRVGYSITGSRIRRTVECSESASGERSCR